MLLKWQEGFPAFSWNLGESSICLSWNVCSFLGKQYGQDKKDSIMGKGRKEDQREVELHDAQMRTPFYQMTDITISEELSSLTSWVLDCLKRFSLLITDTQPNPTNTAKERKLETAFDKSQWRVSQIPFPVMVSGNAQIDGGWLSPSALLEVPQVSEESQTKN